MVHDFPSGLISASLTVASSIRNDVFVIDYNFSCVSRGSFRLLEAFE